MPDVYRAAWEDLAERIDCAVDELRKRSDAILTAPDHYGDDGTEHRRVMAKMRGVLLVKDYMRGYGLPVVTAPRTERQPDAPLSTDSAQDIS